MMVPSKGQEGGGRVSRREMLRTSFAAFAALAAGGCARRSPPGILPGAAPVRPLVFPTISLDRVIRTTAGLRPYRPSGFVVRAERFADTTVIHNYGHGGGGITLSWGSSALAADLALHADTRTAAVIGAGIMGLTTARLLQDRGFQVTIYARELTPYTTSNMSGGQWNPSSVFSFGSTSDSFIRQFQNASSFAWRHYQSLVGPRYGVRWIENYVLLQSPPPESPTGIRSLIPDVFAEWILLGPGEHPFHTPYARRYLTMLVEPATLLDTLSRDVLLRGGRIEVRDFQALEQLLGLEEELIINCTGLGAATLFEDPELTPVKGQLAVLYPDPAVDYIAQFGSAYMFPRSDGIVLGGSYEEGVWSLETDPGVIEGIVEANRRMFGV